MFENEWLIHQLTLSLTGYDHHAWYILNYSVDVNKTEITSISLEVNGSFGVLYCTVLFCTVLYCTVLYCTVLYCTALYLTILYCRSHKNKDMEQAVYRVPPYHYLHVLDQTTNVTRVEIGPQTFVKKDNEQVWTFFFYSFVQRAFVPYKMFLFFYFSDRSDSFYHRSFIFPNDTIVDE